MKRHLSGYFAMAAGLSLAASLSLCSFAAAQEEPQIYGFGADTEDFMVTKDLTVIKPGSDMRVKDKTLTDGTSAIEIERLSNDCTAATASLFTTERRPLLFGRVEDDSYIINVGASQKIESMDILAAEELADVCNSMPRSETGCRVRHVPIQDTLNGEEGAHLIFADRDMEFKFKLGKLKVAEGSFVLVLITANGAAVYDLHDKGKNAVSLTVGNRTLALSPGLHIHATREKTRDFAAINELDTIAHRRLSTSATEDGITIFTSEFSTLSAMEGVPPLKKILQVKHPEARKVANQMIKTSAVLMQLGAGADNFKHHFKQKLTTLASGSAIQK